MYTFVIEMTEAEVEGLARGAFEDGDDQLGWWWLVTLERLRDMQTAKPLIQHERK